MSNEGGPAEEVGAEKVSLISAQLYPVAGRNGKSLVPLSAYSKSASNFINKPVQKTSNVGTNLPATRDFHDDGGTPHLQ